MAELLSSEGSLGWLVSSDVGSEESPLWPIESLVSLGKEGPEPSDSCSDEGCGADFSVEIELLLLELERSDEAVGSI